MKPLVSVAVVNWNGDQFIHRCLEFVFKQTHAPLEVIVVDNGSTDGSLEKIKTRYGSRCRYIENGENVGYSPAMNQGIAASRGEYMVQLNSDACLHEAFIERSLARMEQHPRVGAVGGRVYQWAGEELTDTLRKGEGGRYYFRKRFQLRADENESHETFSFGPASCFPLLRMAMLKDVYDSSGYYFDESFVTGWEDTDLWFRMQLRGWTCVFLPDAYGWHVGSGSAGGNTTFFTKSVSYRTRILRNRLFMMTKNLPASVFLRLSPYLLLTELTMLPYFALRSPSSIRAFFSGWSQFLEQWSRVWQKRARIQRGVVVNADYIQRFFETV
jgi:GT2 family glycosyltransferase